MCWIWLVQGLDCLFFVAQCDNCVHFCFSCIVRTCLNNPNDTGSECEWNFVATDLQPVSWPFHLPKPFRKYKETENKEFKPIRKPYSMFTQENKLIYLCRQNGNPSVSCSQWPPLHHRRVHGTVRKDLRKYIKKNKPGPKVPYVSNRGGGHWLTDGRLTHGWLVQDRFPSLILVRGLTSCGMHLQSPYALWFWSDWQTQTSVFS